MELKMTIEQYIEQLNNELDLNIKELETAQHNCQIVDIDDYNRTKSELEKTSKELDKTKSELENKTELANNLTMKVNEQNKKLRDRDTQITNKDNMLSQLRNEKLLDEYRTNKYKSDIVRFTLEYLNMTFKKGIPYQPGTLKKYLDRITMVTRKEMKETLTQQINQSSTAQSQ